MGEGGHRTYFLNRVPIGGGDTAHISEEGANRGEHQTSKQAVVVIGLVRKRWAAGGWVAGWVVSSE